MERINDFQKTFIPAWKWTTLVTGSKTTRQDKLYQDIYGSASNGHSANGVNSPLHIASRKRHSDDTSDIPNDEKRSRIIDVESAQLPRKKLFVSTKTSEAKALTSASTSVSASASTSPSSSNSVPRRIPLSTPVNESTAAELLERQEEGVRRQLERVGEKLGMLITNRRYDDDDSFFTIKDRRIQSNLYYDFTQKEWMEYSIKVELPNSSPERKPVVQNPKKSYRKRKFEETLARKEDAADFLFSEPLLIMPCSSKKARIETETRQH